MAANAELAAWQLEQTLRYLVYHPGRVGGALWWLDRALVTLKGLK